MVRPSTVVEKDEYRMEEARPFLSSVMIRNYKSIARCAVSLRPLTVLVGRNGAGKSNFLDALRFVADALQTSLDHALKSRGGIEDVRRRSTGHPRNFAVRLEMNLSDSRSATYRFEISARKGGGFLVKKELLEIRGSGKHRFSVTEGKVTFPEKDMPPASGDRLYLVTAAGLPQFREAFDALQSMGFYNLNPAAMKELQSPDAGELLHRDGANISSVVARLKSDKPDVKERIKEYLGKIVPEITEVDRVALGPRETLEFRQRVEGAEHPWRFFAASMSDGTLRALGTLVAVTQLAGRADPIRLVGIEEPEAALHPAACGALIDALREAATHTQVLITSHSADLLDQIDPRMDALLAVEARNGDSWIAPADPATVAAIRDHLYTAGDLLRMDQLQPDVEDIQNQEKQMLLFDQEQAAS